MNYIEKFLFKKIPVWFGIITIFLITSLAIFLMWSLYYFFSADNPHGLKGKIGTKVHKFTELTDKSLRLIDDFFALVEPRKISFSKFQNLKIYDNQFSDEGYILFSSIDINSNPKTFLFSLNEKKKIYEWTWPIQDILKNTKTQTKITKCCFRAQHPLLLKDGSVISNSSEGPLVKINKCSALNWTLDRHTHHSIYLDSQNNIIVPSVINSKPDRINNPTRDDGYLKVDQNGKVIEERSIRDILEYNKYIGLLYGVGDYNSDLIHLNDAEPILSTDKFVKKDDIMFSSRNLSTVFLYRPTINKIIWLKNGPWLKQHDIDYNGNGLFSVYDNGVIDSYNNLISENIPKKRIKNNLNSIKTLDIKNNIIKEKISLTKKHGIFTDEEGLHRVLNNGDVIIEETTKGLIHRISNNNELIWSFANTLSKEYIGSLHWSRYYLRNELDLSWMKGTSCK